MLKVLSPVTAVSQDWQKARQELVHNQVPFRGSVCLCPVGQQPGANHRGLDHAGRTDCSWIKARLEAA